MQNYENFDNDWKTCNLPQNMVSSDTTPVLKKSSKTKAATAPKSDTPKLKAPTKSKTAVKPKSPLAAPVPKTRNVLKDQDTTEEPVAKRIKDRSTPKVLSHQLSDKERAYKKYTEDRASRIVDKISEIQAKKSRGESTVEAEKDLAKLQGAPVVNLSTTTTTIDTSAATREQNGITRSNTLRNLFNAYVGTSNPRVASKLITDRGRITTSTKIMEAAQKSMKIDENEFKKQMDFLITLSDTIGPDGREPSKIVVNAIAQRFGIPTQPVDGSMRPNEAAVERKREKAEADQEDPDASRSQAAPDESEWGEFLDSQVQPMEPSPEASKIDKALNNFMKITEKLKIDPYSTFQRFPMVRDFMKLREGEENLSIDNPEGILEFITRRGDIPKRGTRATDEEVKAFMQELENIDEKELIGNGKYSKGAAIRDTLTKMGVSAEAQKVFLTKSGLFKRHLDSDKADKVPRADVDKILALHGYSVTYPSRKLSYSLVAKKIGA